METKKLLLTVTDREKQGWLDEESIKRFPKEELHAIDRLWRKYSGDRFGFSIQQKIYKSVGGTGRYDENIWLSFVEEVGWTKGGDWLYYSEINFDLNAPKAHLPVLLEPHIHFWLGGLFGNRLRLLLTRDDL